MRLPGPDPDARTARPDLRLPALAAVAWVAALAALLLPRGGLVLGGAALAASCLWWWRRSSAPGTTLLAWWVAAAGVAGVAVLRVDGVGASPVADLAREHAVVSATLRTTSDGVVRPGRFGDVVVVRARVLETTGRGVRHTASVPVLVLADDAWTEVALGTTLRTTARLAPPRRADLAAVLQPRGPPHVVERPRTWWRGAEVVRQGIRDAVAGRSDGPRHLVPALVAGDDAGMATETVADFQVAGLTHLLAVSGTNLTLVVGALLLLARWVGVRGRWLLVVGLVGVVGFVLLARTEPSVVRAAAMGTVALLAMGRHGRTRGTRALAAAVLLLLLWDPWWAVSPGFALSALATAGILWLAPGWRDRMTRWAPRWAAEAVSVPLAAQVACTPVVAALSGQVSLVAVAANLLAAPAVAPATVLGLAGGLVAVISPWVGGLVAAPGAWCAGWIIAVAGWSSSIPVAAVSWPATAAGIAALTLVCVVLAVLCGPLLARRDLALGACLLAGVVMVVPLPSVPLLPGSRPPRDWVMVACDVGQGDGLVLRTREAEAVVVDAGPDPEPMDRCLRRLGIERVPLVLLTHFHADHVDGLAGVLRGREVGAIETAPLSEPAGGVALVRRVAGEAGVPVGVASYGEARRLGQLQWQVVAPSARTPLDGPNDASVVLLVESRGVRLLLLGDQEEPAQTGLLREVGGQQGMDVDVLKVAHHGSADQDSSLMRAVAPELAVISVGAHNDYGHPAPSLLAQLRAVGATVARTDESGDVAVVVDEQGEPAVRVSS